MKQKKIWAILICGGSATGKTILSSELAKTHHCDCIHLDILRKKIQRQYSKKHPINILINNQTYIKYNQWELVKLHQSISKFIINKVSDYLTRRIEKGFVIVEGDDLTTQFYKKFMNKDGVKVVCIYENNPKIISRRISLRDTQKESPGIQIYKNQLQHAFHYGDQIRKLAKANDVPCIKSSPIRTLLKRTQKILDH